MTDIEELDEFVDWTHATHPTVANSAGPNGVNMDLVDTVNVIVPLEPPNSDPNLDLALENVVGDDFSFWALEHFDAHATSFAAPPIPAVANPLDALDPMGTTDPMDLTLASPIPTPEAAVAQKECWETPDAPCDHCRDGGYQCKRIPEGKYKGYCTSCVALRCQCSFGFGLSRDPCSRGATFPHNPWPTLGDHPDPIINYDLLRLNQDVNRLHKISTPDPSAHTPISTSAENTTGILSPTFSTNPPNPTAAPGAGKLGARFSREIVKILKNWLSTHSRHPYPTDEEKDSLVRQTGLNKIQITNWLANARRRSKTQAPRSTSPHPRGLAGTGVAGPIDIPRRPGTPSLFEAEPMNPLQRWVDSPPENEPASATAIARAINTSSSTLSSGLSSPYGRNTDDGSGKSLYNWSSASSLGTSHSSNNSFASAYSHGSRGSMGSLNSFSQRGRRRRRRRQAPRRPEEKSALNPPLKTYQCTFCTLTFRTKHDWQRHEKSLHLSLERWVCAPDGPRMVSPTGKLSCVFCGEANPDGAHIDSHNHSSCQERSLDERTFYRKDHLRQHLKLVHNVKFLAWSMDPWKVATPEIRSRCGFCKTVMDSWTFRVDHLAEHFKTGYSMADWKGDWGFEEPVLQMVENSIPPYLIHEERKTPLPYSATSSPPESPRNAYELLKLELASWAVNRVQDTNRPVSDQELQHEACRIFFGSEVLSHGGISSVPSWFRDLVMSNAAVSESARMSKLRGQNENRLSVLKINGKNNIFDDCPLEVQLGELVKARALLGLTAMDDELQEEACRIIGRMEESSSNPVDDIANWLVRLIYSSTSWLAPFRQRASLPRSEDVQDARHRSKDNTTIDSTIYNFSRLETELAEYVKQQRSSFGVEPTDEDLQRQARLIIYEFDDAWNQTAADNEEWLAAFRQRHLADSLFPEGVTAEFEGLNSPLTLGSEQQQQAQQQNMGLGLGLFAPNDAVSGPPSANPLLSPTRGPGQVMKAQVTGKIFLNDSNCYRRLAQELARWVKSVMSPNNPNSHVPTDSEIQHQARWILYDDDDPWNQTAAENAEWLCAFKRDVGILPPSPPSPSSHSSLSQPRSEVWQPTTGATSYLREVPPPTVTEIGTSLFPPLNHAGVGHPPLFSHPSLLFPTHGSAASQVFGEPFQPPSLESLPVSTSTSTAVAAAVTATADNANSVTDNSGGGGGGGGGGGKDADTIRVNMTESELDNLLRDMDFELDAHADLAATTGLGLEGIEGQQGWGSGTGTGTG